MGALVPSNLLRLPAQSVPDELDLSGVGKGAARRLFATGEFRTKQREHFPKHFTFSQSQSFFGNLGMCYFCAWVLSLLFESPNVQLMRWATAGSSF